MQIKKVSPGDNRNISCRHHDEQVLLVRSCSRQRFVIVPGFFGILSAGKTAT
ncbi:hypothetical protein [Acetobacterium bakii]|uniref:hypothetical protein n=1 Tax=Acetobacterium bakii TaxID=52689 RepID=UPI0013649BEB|nr:hypothetical protein [Acetobacterium bakii]